MALLRKISHFDSNHRLLLALSAAALSFGVVPGDRFSSSHWAIVWTTFALTVLLMGWITILLAHPRDLPQLSALEDSSRTLILVFVSVAALASLFTVMDVLDLTTKQTPHHQRYVLLAIGSVASSWILIHTIFTLRYAHLYYGDDPHQTKPPAGLEFPQESEPDFLDFAYFSFVIGMTSQVSDVAISAKPMRRTALAHGLLSFIFNAIIIALTIGGLAGLV